MCDTKKTKHKKIAEALKESEERFRNLMEYIPGVSVQGYDLNGTVFYWNKASEKVYGYTAEEAIGKNLGDLIIPPDVKPHFRNALEIGKTIDKSGEFQPPGELMLLHKDGHLVPVYSIHTAVNIKGKKPLLFCIDVDLSEHKRTEEKLRNARNELEIKVAQRTTELAEANEELRSEINERKKAEEQLLVYQKQLRSLASELSLAEEHMRRRIATDVHDNVSQNLAISKIKLESLFELVTSPGLTGTLGEVRDLIAQTIESVRSLTFELSPPVLYELGFESAVEWLVRQTRKRYGLSAEFKDDGQPKPLDGNVRILLFQAVRELLVNVAKHAKARNVTVSTWRVNDQIRVSVEDDGVGFDVSEDGSYDYQTGGFGLFSVRERLSHIGGSLDVKSEPGRGTLVTIAVLINEENKNSRGKRK